MNFVAHVGVALSVASPDTDECGVALGAALPDLASMAGLRIDVRALPDSVRQGVVLHHRTDAAFHSLIEFTTGVRQLRERLAAGGLGIGPSRAIGHAGWELLLDGCLLERPSTEEDFSRVLEKAPDVSEAVSPEDPGRWRGLMEAMASEKWWLGYRDAGVVAVRLERRLRSRRRLSFPVEKVPVVAEALSAARAGVGLVAGSVMLAVAAKLTSNCRPP